MADDTGTCAWTADGAVQATFEGPLYRCQTSCAHGGWKPKRYKFCPFCGREITLIPPTIEVPA